jgi:hypothetical protein
VTARCSGFFVSPNGHIITAGHCAQYDDSVRDAPIERAARYAFRTGYYARRPPVGTIRKWAADDWVVRQPERHIEVAYGVASAGLPSGRTLPARLLGLRKAGGAGAQEAGDVALVKIDAEDTPALTIAPASAVEVGTEMVSIGYRPPSTRSPTRRSTRASRTARSARSRRSTAACCACTRSAPPCRPA